tara:strand:+ start:5679 stop:8207 length:2529 start_codon:yes stop_codon:yes gene_type:complete
MKASSQTGPASGLQLDENGPKLVPNLILPPNLESAIERSGQAMVKLELQVDSDQIVPERLDRGCGYSFSEGAARVLWMLENWCGRWPGSLLQLSLERLSVLLEMAGDESIFRMHGKDGFLAKDSSPLRWIADRAAGAVAAKKKTEVAKKVVSKETRRRRPEEERMVSSAGTIDGSEHFLAIELPSREHSAYEEVRERVKMDRFKLEPSNRKWWLRDRTRVLEFLALYGDDIESRWRLKPTENFVKRTKKIRPLEPKIRVDAVAGDSGEFSVSLDWKGTTEKEVEAAVRKGDCFIESGKKILLVNPKKVADARRLQEKARGAGEGAQLFGVQEKGRTSRKVRVKGPALSAIEEALVELDPDWVSPAAWKESVQRLQNPDRVELPDLPSELASRLRGYQKVGVAWFWNLHRNGLGGLLADEMGLGKTVQSLGLLGGLANSENAKVSLVVCPASLVENWVREAGEFLPGIQAHAYHGASRNLDFDRLGSGEIVVTSYGTLRADRALFLKTEFATIIADEAQNFKNPGTETARVMRQLQAESRFALTGTPIENSVTDLVGIGQFALPGILGGRRMRATSDREIILGKVKPYLLRRTKSEVLTDLPEKWESRRFVSLSDAQKKLYEQIRRTTEQSLFRIRAAGGKGGRMTAELWKELLRLRQATAEPRILDETLPREASAKAEGLMEILAETIDSGSRALVFSQFTQTLGWLRKDLEAEGISYCYLDGSTRNRQDLVDRFNEDSSIPVFLLSLKAGGTGLNLTGADTVIHYDPWWNPAAEAQATDRAHRIGQTRKVQSIKLIGAGTVEEKVLRMQDEKRGLLADLFETEGESKSIMDWDSLVDLLED